jgi:hypothetical protein
MDRIAAWCSKARRVLGLAPGAQQIPAGPTPQKLREQVGGPDWLDKTQAATYTAARPTGGRTDERAAGVESTDGQLVFDSRKWRLRTPSHARSIHGRASDAVPAQ